MHPNKRKGTRFEREIVHAAQARGLKARRAYSSDGRTIGEAASTDLTIEGFRLQAKRVRRLPKYLTIPDGADMLVAREDRGTAVVVLPLTVLLDVLERAAPDEQASAWLAGEWSW